MTDLAARRSREATKPDPLSLTIAASLIFLLIFGLGELLPRLSDASPSKWYFPALVLVAAGLAVLTYRGILKSPKGKPIESKRRALLQAALEALVYASIFGLVYLLGWNPERAWSLGLIMGGVAASRRYAEGRKLAHPRLIQAIAAGTAVLVYVVIKNILGRG